MAGRPASELTRRLNETRQTFHNLVAVSRHANIIKERQKRIVDACIVKKLMYGMESVWLLKSERDELDVFFATSLRRVLKIPAALIPSVSNFTVLAKLTATPLSTQLLAHQLKLFGKIARAADGDLCRSLALEPGGLTPLNWNVRRCVGHPRLRWVSCLPAQALLISTTRVIANIMANNF